MASGERVDVESVSSLSGRLGVSPTILAGQQADISNPQLPSHRQGAAADSLGSDMELSQSQCSGSCSPPLLLPQPFRETAIHASKGSMGACTLGESDTLTLDEPGARSGCEEEVPRSAASRPPVMRPLHSAPPSMPDDTASLDPTGMSGTTGDSGVAEDLCVSLDAAVSTACSGNFPSHEPL